MPGLGWRSHRGATPGGGLDAVPASWTMRAEEDGLRPHRPLSNDWIDLWLPSGVGAPVPGGRPSAEPGDGRAPAPP